MTTGQQARVIPTEHPKELDVDPIFAELRRDEPLARIQLPYGGEGWLVTRYDDVRTVLADPRFSREAAIGEDVPRVQPVAARNDTILGMDAPRHTRLRKLVAKAFTARRMEQLRPRVQEVTDAVLDAMAVAGAPADLVWHLALPLPIAMICDMLGVPEAQRGEFRQWSDALLSTTAYSRAEVEQARDDIEAYLADLVAERRRNPQDDVLGDLVLARDNEDRLSEQELVTFGVTLLVAGHETTANQIANFTYTLLTQPEHMRRLRDDSELLPKAIEEMLRFVQLGGGIGFARVATEDVELTGGTVRAGEAVFAAAGPANRDDEVFANPDVLDFDREHNPHIAFGHGIHHCLGAQLARVELQVAIRSLLERFPALSLAVPREQVPWKTGLLVRGPKELLVKW